MNLCGELNMCVSRLILILLVIRKEEPFGGNFKGEEIQGD